jgi:CRP-like cAMP-binding protein
MAQPQTASTRNRILAALSAADAERLRPHLERVSLPLHQVLIERHQPIEHVHFLEAGLSSDTATTDQGEEMEVGMIGREGLVGLAVVHEMDRTSNRSFMQVGGEGLRMRAGELLRAMDESASLRRILNRYAHAFLAQASQSVGCAGRHKLDKRLARWLLTAHDRLEGDDLPLKHEYLGLMLGVRRAGVTVALGTLQKQGIIAQRRGHVVILDRPRLEAASCPCYGIVKAEYDRALV